MQKYEADGYKFESAEPSQGAGEQRYNLIDPDGNNLGYVEYTAKDDILEIGEVRNQTKRMENWRTGEKLPKQEGDLPSTPNVAEKLIDKAISENSNKQIEWHAVIEPGFLFKERYLNKYPNLKSRIIDGSPEEAEIAKKLGKSYNTAEGGSDERLYQSEGQRRRTKSIQRQGSILDSETGVQNQKQVPETLGNEPVLSSNTRLDRREQTPNPNLSPNPRIISAKSSDEILDDMLQGEVKFKNDDDIEGILTKTIEFDPEISGKTWKDIAKDGDKLAEAISTYGEADISAYREAFIKQDTETLNIGFKKFCRE